MPYRSLIPFATFGATAFAALATPARVPFASSWGPIASAIFAS
jgi:hypothetical protein